MKILSAVVIQGIVGPDKILLMTDLPAASYPYDRPYQELSINAAAGSGAEYVRKNFNIEPRVIGPGQ